MDTVDIDDIIASLHRLEAILETMAVDLSDVAAQVAWDSLPFYVRWYRSIKPRKTDMALYGPESNADGPDPQT